MNTSKNVALHESGLKGKGAVSCGTMKPCPTCGFHDEKAMHTCRPKIPEACQTCHALKSCSKRIPWRGKLCKGKHAK